MSDVEARPLPAPEKVKGGRRQSILVIALFAAIIAAIAVWWGLLAWGALWLMGLV